MIRSVSLIPAIAASIVAACGARGGADSSFQVGSGFPEAGEDASSQGEAVAEPDLVIDGQYEDLRFLDMMAAHHEMAIAQAKMVLERAEHAELRTMAQGIVDSQTAEIEQMRSIKQAEYGSTHLPLAMNPHQMDNMGTLTDALLEAAHPFDLAFLDGMIPHHAGAIAMASVARLHSKNARIRTMVRAIIDAQAAEVGKMIEMRQRWYPSSP
jgi:uncharacterized protein (DUF305 family)